MTPLTSLQTAVETFLDSPHMVALADLRMALAASKQEPVWHKASECQPDEKNCPSGYHYWRVCDDCAKDRWGIRHNSFTVGETFEWTPVLYPPLPAPPVKTQEQLDEESFEEVFKREAAPFQNGKGICRKLYFAALATARAQKASVSHDA